MGKNDEEKGEELVEKGRCVENVRDVTAVAEGDVQRGSGGRGRSGRNGHCGVDVTMRCGCDKVVWM